MKVVLHTEEDIELKEMFEPGIEIESDDPTVPFSSLQMFVAAVGLCTFSVLASYAEQIDAPPDTMTIRLRWSYVEDPFRVGEIDMEVRWPTLPDSRLEAARRAAAQCTLHNTLTHPPRITTVVEK